LHAVLVAERDHLIEAWSAETRRAIASASLAHAELLDRMPDFVDQIIAALHPEAIPLPPAGEVAEEHAWELGSTWARSFANTAFCTRASCELPSRRR